MIAWSAPSPSSPAPAARRCAALGLTARRGPRKLPIVPPMPQSRWTEATIHLHRNRLHQISDIPAGSGGLPGLRVLLRISLFGPFRHEARLPGPHHRLRLARAAHDLGRASAVSSGEDDLGAPYVLLRRVAVQNDRLQPAAVSRRDVQGYSCFHSESLNCFGRFDGVERPRSRGIMCQRSSRC